MENINDTVNSFDDNNPAALDKAHFWLRAGAFMIDHFFLCFILFILIVPFGILASGDIESDSAIMPVTFFVIMLIGAFVYCLKDIVKGQSLGKYAVGIAVRNRDDALEIPSAGSLFLRNIFTFLWPVELIVLACSKTKLGDKIAGTDVYRISKKPKLAIIIIAGVLTIVIFTGSLILGVSAMIRIHPSYQMALSYIETNPRIIAQVGEVESFGFFPTGSISTSGGRGQAEFTIRVVGSDDTIRVHILLIREPLRDWEVMGIYYRR